MNLKTIIIFFVILVCSVASFADVNWAKAERFPSIHQKVPGEIRVMIIDTGVGFHENLKWNVQYEKSQDFVHSDYMDRLGHGTHVAGILVYGTNGFDQRNRLCPQVKVYSCKYYDQSRSPEDNLRKESACVIRAFKEKIDLINLSGGGPDFDINEYAALSLFSYYGGVSIVAAGNHSQNLMVNDFFPASYGIKNVNGFSPIPNLIPVGNKCPNGSVCDTSNWYDGIVLRPGHLIRSTFPFNGSGVLSGTSQSSPAYAHDALQEKCNEIYSGRSTWN